MTDNFQQSTTINNHRMLRLRLQQLLKSNKYYMTTNRTWNTLDVPCTSDVLSIKKETIQMSEFAVDAVTTPYLTSHRSDSTWLQSTLKGDKCIPLPYRSVDAKSETSVVR